MFTSMVLHIRLLTGLVAIETFLVLNLEGVNVMGSCDDSVDSGCRFSWFSTPSISISLMAHFLARSEAASCTERLVRFVGGSSCIGSRAVVVVGLVLITDLKQEQEQEHKKRGCDIRAARELRVLFPRIVDDILIFRKDGDGDN